MGQLLSIPRWREEEGEPISEDIQAGPAISQPPPPPYKETEGSRSPIFDAFTGMEKRERPPTAHHPAFRATVKVEVQNEETAPNCSKRGGEGKSQHGLTSKHSPLQPSPPPPPPKITLSRIPEEDTRNSTITSKSTPQWRWSNQQCRSWLACVLVDYGGKSQKKAKQLASEFDGWGPNLYLKTWSQWCEWLNEDGQAIYALLMQEFNKEGAVPRDVTIQHYLRG